ncbi:MAG: hypothetical protein WB662_18215 [Methyloceanibacter sp.]
MRKIVLLLLATALCILIAQLIADAPVIQTRVGMSATPPLMYGAGSEERA